MTERRPRRAASRSCSDVLLAYGSITTLQVYVPGIRPFAVTFAGSTVTTGELPMSMRGNVPVSPVVHWIDDLLPPDTSLVAVITKSVSGVSVKAAGALG